MLGLCRNRDIDEALDLVVSLIVLADVSNAILVLCIFFFQAEDGIRDLVRSRGLGDVYKRQGDGYVFYLQQKEIYLSRFSWQIHELYQIRE